MKIYSMTATFGKLEHETLTLQPGLNLIQAPNEWGKSTWCAFLVTMLYGLDTRERTKKGSLADKERFAPWSGSPMSGRIDLCWKGRDITIERNTKGRIPMGELKAYETATGVTVGEITAANCGQLLLGVERSVFARAGFIRSSEMPVTQDEDLRRRLNALVTTGDESGAAEELGQRLRDLKNRCRYNRKGLIPEAEAHQAELMKKLNDHDDLSRQDQRLRNRQAELEAQVHALQNHQQALRYEAAQDDARRVAEAAALRDEAMEAYRAAEAVCEGLPQREEAVKAQQAQERTRQKWDELFRLEQELPPAPEMPEVPDAFRGMSPAEALQRAKADTQVMDALDKPARSVSLPLIGVGAAAAVIGIMLSFLKLTVPGGILLGAGTLLLLLGILGILKQKRERDTVEARKLVLSRHYGSDDTTLWLEAAHRYRKELDSYQKQLAAYRSARSEVDQRRLMLSGKEPDRRDHQAVIDAWDALGESRRTLDRAQTHWKVLQAMAKTGTPAQEPDELTYTEGQTETLLSESAAELRQIQLRLGQCQGQTALLGSREALQRELQRTQTRIAELERVYSAMDQGLKALAEARSELQRRFAPRITKQAQSLFARLTEGRYHRLTMAEDLSIHAGAKGEDTLRSHLWRSEGTVDQLYLALRLAVAKELTPTAPLILDDALIRFDDRRLLAALQILDEEAAEKQVIVFTCQGRERDHMGDKQELPDASLSS